MRENRSQFLRRVLRIVAFAMAAGVLLSAASAQDSGRTREVRIAAAADLKFALDAVVLDFERTNRNVRISVTYGSSGNFFAQIQNGAPFDMFFSADIDYARKLADAGLGASSGVFIYGVGRIVVWVPASSGLDLEKQGIKALLEPSVRKVAIANPKHAPYGRAAEAAMKSLGVYEAVAPRLVLGENIAQAAQFVQSGSADAGIVALSLAVAPQMNDLGRYWEIPLEAYPKLEQGGLILKTAKDHDAARAFQDHVLGDSGRETLKRFGFYLPERIAK